MNVMLLSVSLWAGAESDPNPATRDLFHWLSALVALPSAAYVGMPFFNSAARALKSRSLNMDVPISLGVILALALSLVQTIAHQRDAYFDSALMLLMFLLAGRVLDQRMRRRARDFATNLTALRADHALRLVEGGEARETPLAAIAPAISCWCAQGSGSGSTGRSRTGARRSTRAWSPARRWPIAVSPGAAVYAGALNLRGALRVG